MIVQIVINLFINDNETKNSQQNIINLRKLLDHEMVETAALQSLIVAKPEFVEKLLVHLEMTN